MSEYAKGKHPNSLKNLQPHEPGYQITTEQARKAGLASGEARRKRRLMRDALRDILDAPIASEDLAEMLKGLGVTDPTNADGISLAAARRALQGDVDAARFVRDTAGERPTTAVELGNLDERPFETLNLAEMTDEQLMKLMNARTNLE